VIVYVCVSGDEYASRFLIENGADVNIALPESQLTPLHLAVLQSHDLTSTNRMSGIIELLLEKSADANACDSSSRWVLYTPELRTIKSLSGVAFSQVVTTTTTV